MFDRAAWNPNATALVDPSRRAFLEQITSERVCYTVAPRVLLNLILAKPELLEGVDLSSIGT